MSEARLEFQVETATQEWSGFTLVLKKPTADFRAVEGRPGAYAVTLLGLCELTPSNLELAKRGLCTHERIFRVTGQGYECETCGAGTMVRGFVRRQP